MHSPFRQASNRIQFRESTRSSRYATKYVRRRRMQNSYRVQYCFGHWPSLNKDYGVHRKTTLYKKGSSNIRDLSQFRLCVPESALLHLAPKGKGRATKNVSLRQRMAGTVDQGFTTNDWDVSQIRIRCGEQWFVIVSTKLTKGSVGWDRTFGSTEAPA